MKKILKFIKRFPLTSYGLLAIIITIFTYFHKDYADSVLLMLVALPVFVIYGKICDLIYWDTLSSYTDIFLMFFPVMIVLIFLDFLLWFFCPNLISKLKSKFIKK